MPCGHRLVRDTKNNIANEETESLLRQMLSPVSAVEQEKTKGQRQSVLTAFDGTIAQPKPLPCRKVGNTTFQTSQQATRPQGSLFQQPASPFTQRWMRVAGVVAVVCVFLRE